LDICETLHKSKDIELAKEKLPPASGFFFGSTEMDEGYWQDIENTIEILKRAIEAKNDGLYIYYQSSW